MKPNAIFFSRVVKHKQNNIGWQRAIVNFSLQSLEKQLLDSRNFDVFFFIDGDDNWANELTEQYDWLKIIKFNNQEYVDAGLQKFDNTQLQAHKYFNFKYFADKHYEQIMMLDNDTYFSGDPSVIFDRYQHALKYCLTVLYPGPDVPYLLSNYKTKITNSDNCEYNGTTLGIKTIHGIERNMNSGQMLLKKHHIQTIYNRLIPSFIAERKRIDTITKQLEQRGITDKFDSNEGFNFLSVVNWVADEPCIQKVLHDHSIHTEPFDSRDVEYYLDAPRNDSSIITHYGALAKNLQKIMPKEFIKKYVKEI